MLTTMERFAVSVLVAASVAVACGSGEQSVASPRASGVAEDLLPVQRGLNVIVISFDALRQDALGVYGNRRGATPAMDEFAKDSVVFTNAYSVAPVTPTSFAAAWSGLLPSRVFHGWKLRATSTLASRMRDAGYRTQAIVNNVQLAPERGFDLGFDGYDWRRTDPEEKLLQAAKIWVENRGEGPFFLWVHFLRPHAPYKARPEAAHLYRESEVGQFSETTGEMFETSDPAGIARIRDLYFGEVWTADRLFGELVDTLRDQGLLESSVVVLTADHGEELADHGGFQHGRLYEEHLRIPLIIRHPLAKGRLVESRVRNVDLMPTLLHTVGVPMTEVLDGRIVEGPSSGGPPPLVAIAMTGAQEQWVSFTSASRKVILTCMPKRGGELYDLASDPGEQRDLATESPREVRELIGTLRTLLGGDPCTVIQQAARGTAPTVGLDPESVEALRALGYLD